MRHRELHPGAIYFRKFHGRWRAVELLKRGFYGGKVKYWVRYVSSNTRSKQPVMARELRAQIPLGGVAE